MRNLERRLRKLESGRFDETGLVPRSDAWYEFYEDRVARLTEGEHVGYIPLEVIDRLMEAVDLENQMAQTGASGLYA
jgi:hypothetical protein